jgi:hypothetical protein
MKTIARKATVLSAISIAAFSLVGCTSAPKKEPQATDPAAVLLKEGIARTANETAEFTASVQATPKPAVMAGSSITLNFAGDAKTLLAKVAAANGLKFTILGPQPRLPLFISVDVANVPLEVFLRDVAEQFGQRASLALNDGAIEIRYRGVGAK